VRKRIYQIANLDIEKFHVKKHKKRPPLPAYDLTFHIICEVIHYILMLNIFKLFSYVSVLTIFINQQPSFFRNNSCQFYNQNYFLNLKISYLTLQVCMNAFFWIVLNNSKKYWSSKLFKFVTPNFQVSQERPKFANFWVKLRFKINKIKLYFFY
jgi:hypothetical protein